MRSLTINGGDILNHAAVAVFTHRTLTRLSGQPTIKAFLNAFNTFAIDIGHTDNVRHNLASGIITAGFLAQIDARQFQLMDIVANGRVDLASQINKATFWIGVDSRCVFWKQNRLYQAI